MYIRGIKKSGLVAFCAMALNFSLNAQNLLQQDSLILALGGSFQSKNAENLRPYLAENFSIGVFNRPAADGMLQSIIQNYPIDSIALGKIDSVGAKTRMGVVIYNKGKTITTLLYLNSKREILYVDLFDKLYGVEKYQASKLRAIIPFDLVNGAIVISARLNGSDRPLRFLFDTGADGMAIRKSLADSLGLTIARQQNVSAVGGNMQVSISTGNTLHLDTLKMAGCNIAVFDNIGESYDGILGCNIATRYITKVDFDKQVIELYNFGNYEFEKGGFSVDVKFSGVPLIPLSLKVGNKSVKGTFIFDSGANYYLIAFGPFVKKNLLLTNGFVPSYTGSTVSMGRSSTTFTGNFEKMSFGNAELQNFPGVLQAHSGVDEKWDVAGDGSLGIETMRRFNFTLNLAQHKIHFTPNKVIGNRQ